MIHTNMNPAITRLDTTGKTLSSIELLEECLSAIHRCRRSCLEDKLRSHRRQSASVSALKSAAKENQAAAAYHRNITVSKMVRQESAETPIRSLNETAPVQQSAPHARMPSTDDEDEPQGNTESNEDIASNANSQLKDEMHAWWEKNSKKRDDEDERGDFADFMTEKYMCQVLDPLPPSKKVSAIRKDVSQMLESFVSTGVLPPRAIVGKSKTAAVVKPTEKQVAAAISAPSLSSESNASLENKGSSSNTDAKKDNRKAHVLVEAGESIPTYKVPVEAEQSGKRKESDLSARSDTRLVIEKQKEKVPGVVGESSFLAGKMAKKANNDSSYKIMEDKREKEKLQIKEQYEKFRKLKADSDAIAASEHVKEVENNLDGIRNLLNSIQAAK